MERGHTGWLAGAAVAVGSLALAVLAPASWWGVTFVVGVLAALLAARPVVPAAYALSWTRTTVLLTLIAAVPGIVYAFEVGPWGPRPRLYAPVVFVVALVGVASFVSTPGGRRNVGGTGGGQHERAHRNALRQDPR